MKSNRKTGARAKQTRKERLRERDTYITRYLLPPNPLPEWPGSDEDEENTNDSDVQLDLSPPPSPRGLTSLAERIEDVHDFNLICFEELSLDVVQAVLQYLHLRDINSFSETSRRNFRIGKSDVVWRNIFRRNDFLRPYQDSCDLRPRFLKWRSICCVECGTPTRYVFAILGHRLCEYCEKQRRDYFLISKSDAKEFFLLSNKELASLAYLDRESPLQTKSSKIRFYLRSQVVSIAEDMYGGRAGLKEEQKRVRSLNRALEDRRALARNRRRSRHKRKLVGEESMALGEEYQFSVEEASSVVSRERQELEFGKYGISGLEVDLRDDIDPIIFTLTSSEALDVIFSS